jgi:hypothetical protein
LLEIKFGHNNFICVAVQTMVFGEWKGIVEYGGSGEFQCLKWKSDVDGDAVFSGKVDVW